jgi:hypothetical protein
MRAENTETTGLKKTRHLLDINFYIEPTESTRTFRYPVDLPVAEVLSDLYETYGQLRDHGIIYIYHIYYLPDSLGIFRPPQAETGEGFGAQKATQGIWLDKKKTLRSYQFKQKVELIIDDFISYLPF